jgi:hypothetical protein
MKIPGSFLLAIAPKKGELVERNHCLTGGRAFRFPFCSRSHNSGIVPITANSIHIFRFVLSQ